MRDAVDKVRVTEIQFFASFLIAFYLVILVIAVPTIAIGNKVNTNKSDNDS